MISKLFEGAGLIAAALVTAGCNTPNRVIRPVIHALPEDKYQAMKSAPVIVMVEVLDYKLVSGPREVGRPGNALNPVRQMIPLHLARISANVMLSLRGNHRGLIHFYAWVWASGRHGGSRLFRYFPGYCHILFLREEGGYLHTVGDYPAYDIEIPRSWLPAIISGMEAPSEGGSDLFERIVTVRLRAELETGGAISRDSWPSGLMDLEGLTSPFYVASRLDSFCRNFTNPFGRFAACMLTAQQYYGRCEAYRIARKADPAGVEAVFVAEALARCEAQQEDTLGWLRTNKWRIPGLDYGRPLTAERKRLAIRLYASAMDPKFRAAACQAAATMPEARDIPECATSGPPKSAPAHPRTGNRSS